MAGSSPALLQSGRVQTLEIKVRGMSCASCMLRVEKAIRAAERVGGATVNLATERASVPLTGAAGAAAVGAAIRAAGYEPVEENIEIRIEGMTCASCVGRVTNWFVPAVMGIAAVTFLVWFFFGPRPELSLALVNAVAVLIIARPCAMGLATPTSIMVGAGKAADMGVMFRRGDALQSPHGRSRCRASRHRRGHRRSAADGQGRDHQGIAGERRRARRLCRRRDQ